MEGLRRSARIAARAAAIQAELQQQGEAGVVEQPAAQLVAQPAAGQNVGGNSRPQEINVDAGEDVAAKIIAFAAGHNVGISILSAHGTITRMKILEPGSRGRVKTIRKTLELVSLSGIYKPAIGRERKLWLSALAGDDSGMIWGGRIRGGLKAVTPVKVFVSTWQL